MPQPSRWGPVPPPRWRKPVKLKQMSVGTLALMPKSSHMGFLPVNDPPPAAAAASPAQQRQRQQQQGQRPGHCLLAGRGGQGPAALLEPGQRLAPQRRSPGRQVVDEVDEAVGGAVGKLPAVAAGGQVLVEALAVRLPSGGGGELRTALGGGEQAQQRLYADGLELLAKDALTLG